MNRLLATLLLGSYIFLAVNYLWPPYVVPPLLSDDPNLHLPPLHKHPIVAVVSTGRSPAVAAELPPASLFHPLSRAPAGTDNPSCVHEWYAPVCCAFAPDHTGGGGATRVKIVNACLCAMASGIVTAHGECPSFTSTVGSTAAMTVTPTPPPPHAMFDAAADAGVAVHAAVAVRRWLPGSSTPCPRVYAPVCCMYNNDPGITATMANVCLCELGRGKIKATGDCPDPAPVNTVTNTAIPTAERKLPAFGGACPHVYAPVCCMYNNDPSTTASMPNHCLCELGRGTVRSQGDCPDPTVPGNTVTTTGAPTTERKLPAKFGGTCPHVYAPVCCMYNNDPGVVVNISNACICALGRGKVKSEGDCTTSHSTTTTTPSPVAPPPAPLERQAWTPGIGRDCPHTYAPVCCMYNGDPTVVANISSACVCELGRGTVKSHGDCPTTSSLDNAAAAAEAISPPPVRRVQAASADNLWTGRTSTRSRTGSSGSGSGSRSVAELPLPLTPQIPPTAVKLPSDMVNPFGRRCSQDWAPVCCMFNGDPEVRFTMHNACACETVRGAVIASTACADGKADKKHGMKKRSKSACHTIKGCLNKMFS